MTKSAYMQKIMYKKFQYLKTDRILEICSYKSRWKWNKYEHNIDRNRRLSLLKCNSLNTDIDWRAKTAYFCFFFLRKNAIYIPRIFFPATRRIEHIYRQIPSNFWDVEKIVYSISLHSVSGNLFTENRNSVRKFGLDFPWITPAPCSTSITEFEV